MIIAEIAPGLYQATEVQSPYGYSLPEERTQYFGVDALAKEKKEGRTIWATAIGGEYSDIIRTVEQTKDGGYIAGGEFNSDSITLDNGQILTNKDKYHEDGILIKYNSNNEIEWATSIGGKKDERISSVAQMNDEGYIVGGEFWSSSITLDNGQTLNNNNSYEGMLIKYTKNGEVEWGKAPYHKQMMEAL